MFYFQIDVSVPPSGFDNVYFFSAFVSEFVNKYHFEGPVVAFEFAELIAFLWRRYLATSWLSSPHLQTAFLSFFGRPPVFSYRRQLFHTSDGGTIALDWLMNSDVMGVAINMNDTIRKDDKTPIVVVIPGLTSDSASAYIKHLAFKMAKSGWNVVVSNHRGLGGISVTVSFFS
ncbi:Embryogenesis-associated protein EMB8 [Vitis vinifera]|uniref:Embryogenesis-associated protein EMB8 n=1 Tax=Vitis vinifera TaxID=29760 RepID=A0A438GUK9_VITVI|nr:Embryogenesis-associated protein EMB8 [Vitis vinifera]